MRRILVSRCKQEVSSFNPVLARHGDFLIDLRQAIIIYHHVVRSETGGAVRVFPASVLEATSANLQSLGHKRCRCFRWMTKCKFTPKGRAFRRGSL